MMAEDEEKAQQEKAEGGATAMQALRQEDGHPEDVVEGEEEEEDEEEEEGEGAASEATSISSGASRAPSPAATTTAAAANGFPGPRGAKEAPGGPAGELPDAAGAVTGEDRLSSASQEPPSPEWHECPECGRGFGTSRALKVHRSYHIGRKRPHGGGGGPPSSPSLLGPPGAKAPPPPDGPPSRGRAFHYICAECGLGFASPASLEGHRCEHGWRQRGVPGALPRHKPVPSPSPAPAGGQANGGTEEEEEAEAEGPYHCTECPGEFGLVSQLHQHYMLHARGEL